MRRIVKELAVIALLGTFATAAPASIIITQDSEMDPISWTGIHFC